MNRIAQTATFVLCLLTVSQALDSTFAARARARFGAEAEGILAHIRHAEETGLPTISLVNKVYEGMAKGVSAGAVSQAVEARSDRLARIAGENPQARLPELEILLFRAEKAASAAHGAPARVGSGDDAAAPGSIEQSEKSAGIPDIGDRRQHDKLETRLLKKQEATLERLEKKQQRLEKKSESGRR